MKKLTTTTFISVITIVTILSLIMFTAGCATDKGMETQSSAKTEAVKAPETKDGEKASSAAGTVETPAAKEVKEEPAESSTNGLGITDEKYEKSIKASLLSKGNNYLIKKLLEKLKAGEENVYIAALGGSVTEGAGPAKFTDGYAYQFNAMLTEKYAADRTKVFFDGAGIGGTPSPLGLVRYEKDVIQTLGTNPDLLIIEFAVNDWQECSNTRAFEYLIRNALENGTAVIALYAAATYGNQQQAMSPVAKFYKIPEVSISKGLQNSGINQKQNSKIYYTDNVHPTKNGHKFMAECIMNLFAEIEADETNEAVPVPENYKNSKPFTVFKPVYGNTEDENVTINPGSFNQKDSSIQNYMKGGKSFPENWMHKGEETESFVMNLECKSLIFVYKDSNSKSFGNAEVYIDGQLKKTIKGASGQGWNNCAVTMIIDEAESKPHTVEIKMADADSAKSFTILAMGYAK